MKLTAASDQSGESQQKPVVLVADDSRVMRVALTRILKEEYTVLEAEHGEDAWAKLTAEPNVQMVFSDLSMPELDGFGLLGRIRGSDQARIREVPFIVITGNEDDQTVREKAMANGATDFILKPFQSVEIKARAKAHVDHLRKLGSVSEQLEQNTVQDELTGLANRRHFHQRADEALAFAQRQNLPMAVLQIQVDRYQALRQEKGETAATEALVSVGAILRARIRTEDTLAHFQDGLFAVLSVAADQVGAAQLAGRVAEAVGGVGASAGNGLTVSVGIAVSTPGSETSVEDLLARGERLLAKAVRKGGNTVVAEDYVQAHSPERSPAAKGDAEAASKLRERLSAMEAELAAARDMVAGEQEQAQALRQELERANRDLEQHRAAAQTAQHESQAFGQEVEQLRAEVENLRYGAGNAETVQAELQHSLDSLRAQLEEASTELDEHRARLESELANRHAVESELAKLKLQELARREAEQKAAEQPQPPAPGGGWFARLRARLSGASSA